MAKAKNLQWGSANRPKISNKLGIPHSTEGSNGDIQVRQTNLGTKLFAKLGGRWSSTFLSSEEEIIGTGGTKIGMDSSGNLNVENISLSGRIILNSNTESFTLGASNVMIGTDALKNPSHTSGQCEQNIAIGHQSMEDLTGGVGGDASISNVAIGVGTGRDLSTNSSNNIIIGTNAMRDTATATGNVAIGIMAIGESATSNSYNTCIGYNAGLEITTSNSNTCVGRSAGNAITSGSSNITIGNGSDAAATSHYQIALGGTTTGGRGIVIGFGITAAADRFVFGKASNTMTNDFTTNNTWTQSSDERKKRNIQNDTLGLSFINDLKTKTFQWKPANEHPEEWQAWDLDDDDNKIYHEMNTDAVMHGLIAQDVKSALDTANISTFKGWSQTEKGEQQIASGMFVYPLIKAVQELSAKVDAMQIEINNLK